MTDLHRVFILLLLSGLFACSNSSSDDEPAEATTLSAAPTPTSPAEIPLVTLAVARRGRLPLRRQTTGKLRARREVVVKSRAGGLVETAPVEGGYYEKGTPLLVTDVRAAELARGRAAAAREEAAFRHRNLLMQMQSHFAAGDSTELTPEAERNLLIQSGLPAAEAALAEADHQLALTRLAAPFSGRAADVKIQTGQLVSPGEEICTLVDLASLEAEFSLLEQELAGLTKNTTVYVSTVNQPDLRLPATLDIINPRVDQGGLLRVRARLRKTAGQRLYPGMNVTVTLEQESPEVVLLPKSAVVTRSGKTLVFAYDEASELAKWQYVTVGYENDELIGLTEGVEKGQQVIVGGNLNLDHDSRVRVE